MSALDQNAALRAWADRRRPPVERLARFKAWLGRELETRLRWPVDDDARAHQARQCVGFVLEFVHSLEERGWLFDGPTLARVIGEALAEVRAAQDRASKPVRDIFPFLRSILTRYAGARAEELRELAVGTSSTAGLSIERALALVSAGGPRPAPTMTEIAAEDWRAAIHARRQPPPAKPRGRPRKTAAPQPELFG